MRWFLKGHQEEHVWSPTPCDTFPIPTSQELLPELLAARVLGVEAETGPGVQTREARLVCLKMAVRQNQRWDWDVPWGHDLDFEPWPNRYGSNETTRIWTAG